MVASIEHTNLRPATEEDTRDAVIETVEGHVTRLLVTQHRPRTDLRAFPRSERMPVEGAPEMAADVWQSIETVGHRLYVVATVYGVRMWDETKARIYRGDFCFSREQQKAAEWKSLENA
jgi:hypothetical protein